MAGAKIVWTRWPGIGRRGSRWVYEWTDAAGKRRRGTADTRENASAAKAREEGKAASGDLPSAGGRSRATVAGYALELYGADRDRPTGEKPARGRYAGRRGAVRENTLNEYRRDVERYWLPVIGDRALAKVRPVDLSRAVGDLAARDGDEYLADRTIRRLFAPAAAMFATAVEEGLILHNPTRDVTLPSGRDRLRKFDENADDGDDPAPGKARAMTREQLASFLLVVDPKWRVFFALLGATGLRVSEALALQWRHLRLDGDRPVVQIRRARVRGRVGPPKSESGFRSVPLDFELVRALRARRKATEWPDDGDLVFPSRSGSPMSAENLARRTLKPAAEEAGVPWCGFHTFRHTVASLLFAEGRNAKQVQAWLGHSDPAFTLRTYVHLLDDGVGGPLPVPQGVGLGSGSGARDSSGVLDAEDATPRFAGISQP